MTEKGTNMPTSPTATLYSQLAKAQGKMEAAKLNQENPHFRSKFADLASLREATLPVLSEHDLAIVQYTTLAENQVVLRTRLAHGASGEFIESEWPIPLDKPQQMGSSMTYGRRYCWAAMCGQASELDDDANQAQKGRVPAGKGRDITHGVGTMAIDPSKGQFDLVNPWGEVEDTYSDAFKFMANVTTRVESTGGWWPNNAETVKQIGIRAKEASSKAQNAKDKEASEKLRKVAHSTMTFGIDAWKQCPENPVNAQSQETPKDDLDDLPDKPTEGPPN